MTQILLLPPRGLVETLPLTSLLSCATLAARPGNWDPADHRGSRLGRTRYGSVGRTTFTLQERSLLRASRVCTPGLVSTATLPSVIRGGYNNNTNTNNNNINTTAITITIILYIYMFMDISLIHMEFQKYRGFSYRNNKILVIISQNFRNFKSIY